mgnify:CR=1 FL=1
MSVDKIIAEARKRRQQSLLRRWAHYECLKDRLQELDLTPKEYEQAARKIVRALGL